VSAPVIAFLGWDDRRTFLVHHLAWMYAELGYKVVAMDLNPQASLTASFLSEEKLGEMWRSDVDSHMNTIYDWLASFYGEKSFEVHQEQVGNEAGLTDRLSLVASDPLLVDLERDLQESGEEDTSAKVDFFRELTSKLSADIVLVDLGYYPSTVARLAWTAAGFGIFSVSPEPLSLRGLGALGDTLLAWRAKGKPGTTRSEGYVVLDRPVRVDRSSSFLETGLQTIPEAYRIFVLKQYEDLNVTIREDPHCLGYLRETSGLLDMAREARKPVFLLKPADGAIGSLALAVQDAYRDFERLALRIAGRVGLPPIPL
jgi:cellulose biosynthesis protein BcsQ